MSQELPEGFTLDSPPQQTAQVSYDDLPDGFTLDEPAPVTESATPIQTPQRVNKLVLPEKTVQPLSRFDRVLKGMRDPIDAGAQLITKALPEGYLDAADRKLYEATGGVLGAPEGALKQVSDAEAEYQARREAGGESGIDAYRIAGNVVSPANLAIASKIPVATSLGGKILTGAGVGGVYGALTPTTQGDENFAKEKAAQIGLGAITGGVIPAIGAGIGRVISPNASTNPALALLQKEGVKPTIGQALGGRANALEEKAMSIPIMGDMIKVARNRAADAIEPAAHNRALSVIGEQLPKGLKGFEAVAHTKDVLNKNYTKVLDKIGAIVPDEQFAAKTASLDDLVGKLRIPENDKQAFAMALDDVRSAIDENGVITSEAYKLAESNLSTIGRSLKGASVNNPYANKVGTAVSQLKDELQSMLKRQAGSNADELKKANKAWANFKRVEKAADAPGADMGSFTPAQLDRAVRSMEKGIGTRTTGNALMQDLSSAAKSIISDRVPNSATADRAMLAAGTFGAGTINPLIPAAAVSGAAAYTSPVQNALVSLVTKRPEFAKALASEVNRLGGSKGAQTVPAMIAARQE